MGTVAVLAGRRADGAGAERPALPDAAREPVRAALRSVLIQNDVDLLVASAACGADLLGLLAAGDLGVRTRIVLPFSIERFREESVSDRGGDWGEIYDRLVSNADASGSLVIRRQDREPDPFSANNDVVISEALASGAARCVAIIVWDGRSKGPEDATADLARRARENGFELIEVSPLELIS